MGTAKKPAENSPEQEKTPELYPAKKPKVVKPIKVAAADTEHVESKASDHEVQPESEPQGEPKSKDVVSEATNTSADSTDKPEDSDADDNATQVPDTDAALKHEFIDEGQYRITVPKKRKPSKSSKLSKLLWFVFIVFLFAIAGYLYTEVFGVDLKDILEFMQQLIGQ